MPTEPRLTPELITADLHTHLLPSTVLCYQQLGSTMDVARERARAGSPEGLLVLAEEQTAGRGRMGRSWFAPPGSALLSSFLLRPCWMHPTNVFELTMLAAVSLCAAIEDITPLRPVLKWPNDVMLAVQKAEGKKQKAESEEETQDARCEMRDAELPSSPRRLVASSPTDHQTPTTEYRKAAGILIDLEVRGGKIAWGIVGCGVNVHSYPPAGPEQTYLATSLDAAAGQWVERIELLRALLRHLDANYDTLRTSGGDALFEDWRRRLIMLGKQVRVATPGGMLAGTAEDVARSGALLVRDAQGELHTVTAGDVAA